MEFDLSFIDGGAWMKLKELSEKVGAKTYTEGRHYCLEVRGVCAGDRMSDLLVNASEKELLVTGLNNEQIILVSQLMDVPAVCLLNSTVPSEELIKKAEADGITIIVSPYGMFETCGRIYRCLFCGGE
jgi:hypothetical protein